MFSLPITHGGLFDHQGMPALDCYITSLQDVSFNGTIGMADLCTRNLI